MRRNQLRKSLTGTINPRAPLIWAAGVIPANSSAVQQIALAGARLGDICLVSHDPTAPGLIFSGQVCTADNAVTVQCTNASVNPLDPGNLNIYVTVV